MALVAYRESSVTQLVCFLRFKALMRIRLHILLVLGSKMTSTTEVPTSPGLTEFHKWGVSLLHKWVKETGQDSDQHTEAHRTIYQGQFELARVSGLFRATADLDQELSRCLGLLFPGAFSFVYASDSVFHLDFIHSLLTLNTHRGMCLEAVLLKLPRLHWIESSVLSVQRRHTKQALV